MLRKMLDIIKRMCTMNYYVTKKKGKKKYMFNKLKKRMNEVVDTYEVYGYKYLNKTEKLLLELNSGQNIPVKEIRTLLKLKNAGSTINRLRETGFRIYTNKVTTPKGKKVTAYRMSPIV